ncbi:cytochrome-c oxidase [Brevibacillus sp. 179-C9.3 HS]|uniref:cytochrome-c oxidase n=1 Tax=unclassified Brevibacillus TaxID=2684853 RepID=UPI0039A0E08B
MAVRFLKIAAFYFLVAVVLGLIMGITKNFAYTSVHVHLNLLGWVSMAIMGLIYYLYPHAANTKLASCHFWLHNIFLPVMQGSLFFMILLGQESLVIGVIVGSIGLVVGILLYVINLWKQIQ